MLKLHVNLKPFTMDGNAYQMRRVSCIEHWLIVVQPTMYMRYMCVATSMSMHMFPMLR